MNNNEENGSDQFKGFSRLNFRDVLKIASNN